MFPLDPFFVWILKFFVVITCVAFWLNLGITALMRHQRLGSYRPIEPRDKDE